MFQKMNSRYNIVPLIISVLLEYLILKISDYVISTEGLRPYLVFIISDNIYIYILDIILVNIYSKYI